MEAETSIVDDASRETERELPLAKNVATNAIPVEEARPKDTLASDKRGRPSQISESSREKQTELSPDTVIDLRIKGYQAALDWSKHLATLATGILVLSGTFMQSMLPKHGDPPQPKIINPELMSACWAMMFVSVVFGVFYLGSVCRLFNEAKYSEEIDIYQFRPRCLAVLQVLTFAIGLGIFALFMYCNHIT